MTPGTGSRTATPVPVADVTAGFASAAAAVTLALSALYTTVPATRGWLGTDHGLVAWFTRSGYLAATALGVWALRRAPAPTRMHRLVVLLAVWGLADSVAYGAALSGTAHLSIGGESVSSLGTLADALGVWAADLALTPYLGITWATLVLLAAAVIAGRARRWAAARVMVAEPRVAGLLVACVACHALTPAIGALGPSDLVSFSARLATLSGSGLLVATALAIADHRRTVAGWRFRLRPWLDPRSQ